MNNFKRALTPIFVSAVLLIPMPALAKTVVNEWNEIDDLIENVSGCGDASAFFLEGMEHVKISTLRNGGAAVNINIIGDFTAVDGSYEGEAAIFRQNINEILPVFKMVDDELVQGVYTFKRTVKIIGKGQADNYHLNATFHITEKDGEIKSFVDRESITCD